MSAERRPAATPSMCIWLRQVKMTRHDEVHATFWAANLDIPAWRGARDIVVYPFEAVGWSQIHYAVKSMFRIAMQQNQCWSYRCVPLWGFRIQSNSLCNKILYKSIVDAIWVLPSALNGLQNVVTDPTPIHPRCTFTATFNTCTLEPIIFTECIPHSRMLSEIE